MKTAGKSFPLLLISLAISALVFLKNAWVSEDAYILFRSIEQLFEGNGPVWNPHERVQVFTSPLWFWLLSIFRIFSSNVFLNSIVAGFALWIATVITLSRVLRNHILLLAMVLALMASNAFFDYVSSGLENGLAYMLIVFFLVTYQRLFFTGDGKLPQSRSEKRLRYLLLIYGLVICVRHDLSLLLFPPVVFTVFTRWRIHNVVIWIRLILVLMSLILIWSLFSLVYYGFLFPNTFYAKLNTGIGAIELWQQGVKYFWESVVFDPITLSVIVTAITFTLFYSKQGHHRYIGYGVILNLVYILSVGGDFMQGRFLSYAFLVSVFVLFIELQTLKKTKILRLGWVPLVLYLLLFPHTPVNSAVDYENRRIESGVADERGFYFNKLSLYRYIFLHNKLVIFPAFQWSFEGLEFSRHADLVQIHLNIGVYGYWAGTEKIVVDPLALADPLLARLPVKKGEWRVGHFERDVPEGYVEGLTDGITPLADNRLNAYYSHLKLVTRGESLFSFERLKTVVLLNLGAYNFLLDPSG